MRGESGRSFSSSTSQHARSCVRVSRPPIHSCDDVIGCAKRSDTPSTITDRGEGEEDGVSVAAIDFQTVT